MKVLDYALGGLVATADVAQHPRQRTAVSYPTPGFSAASAPYAPVPTATGLPYGMTPDQHRANLIIKPRYLVARNVSIDATKPMLGLYSEDQVTTEVSTFENGIDPTKWVLDTRSYGGATNNPYMRKMEPKNVEVKDGLLKLKVPGGQTYDPVTNLGLSSAQIKSMKIFSVGSLEITVRMSGEEGTCQCAFLYGADDNEVDMEYLTRTKTSWGVIQPMKQGIPIQQKDLNITTDQTADFHTYKVVRTENQAYFLYDGKLVNSYSKDVPTNAVQAMIAHWTDANPGWTGGPPAQDATMEIKKVVVEYVGTTSTFSTSVEGASPTGDAKKGAASRQYGSAVGPLLAMAAVLSYFAL